MFWFYYPIFWHCLLNLGHNNLISAARICYHTTLLSKFRYLHPFDTHDSPVLSFWDLFLLAMDNFWYGSSEEWQSQGTCFSLMLNIKEIKQTNCQITQIFGNVSSNFFTTYEPVTFSFFILQLYRKKSYIMPDNPALTKFLRPQFFVF